MTEPAGGPRPNGAVTQWLVLDARGLVLATSRQLFELPRSLRRLDRTTDWLLAGPLSRALHTGDPVERVRVTADGERHQIRVEPIVAPDDLVVGAVASVRVGAEMLSTRPAVGGWCWTLQPYRRTRWSPELYSLYGLARDAFRELSVTEWLELVDRSEYPALQELWDRHIERAVNNDLVIHDVRIHRGNDGAARLLRFAGRAEIVDGRPVRFAGFSHDVTDLTPRHDDSPERDFLSRVLSVAPPMFLLDLLHDELVWSSRHLEVHARTSIPDVLQRVHPDDRGRAARELARWRSLGPEETVSTRFRVNIDGASWQPVTVKVTPYFQDSAGRVDTLLIALHEVPE